jgi:hypothetical protein
MEFMQNLAILAGWIVLLKILPDFIRSRRMTLLAAQARRPDRL